MAKKDAAQFVVNAVKRALSSDAEKALPPKGGLSAVRNLSRSADEEMEAKRLAREVANPPIKASEAYGRHEGAYLKPIFYDRMKVDLSKGKLGGPGFSGIQLVDPNYANAKAVAGVTDQKMATRILNRNKAQVPEGAKVIWTPSVGGLEQHKSNSTMFGEFADIFSNQRKNMSAEEIQKLSDRASNVTDNKGRLIFPNGIDLGARNFRQQVKTYDQRSLMADIFAGRGVGGEKGRTVPVEELLEKNLDPNMANAGTLDLGNRLFRLEGDVLDRPDLHSDYRKILTGEDLDVNYLPVPIKDVYGDWEVQKAFELAARGKNRPVTMMDYTKNDPTVQLTDDLLTKMQKAGHKDGGAIHGDDQELKAMIADHLDSQAHDQELRAMVDNHLAGGGAPKAIAKGFKKLFGNDVLPAVEREDNLAKMLEGSATKERMYHATGDDFTSFSPEKTNPESKFGKGIYMTPNTNKANFFANIRTRQGKNAQVMPVYSSIKNPYEIQGVQNIPLNGIDQKKLKDLGYDGIFYRNDAGELQEAVAFEPTQVKSAIGNRGTYDINEADINKAGGGLLKSAAKAGKRLFADDALPALERDFNLQKFLEPSKAPMRLYHGTTATEGGKGNEAIRRIKPSKEGSLGSGVYLTPKSSHASGYTGIPNDEALALMSGDPYAKKMADQFMADRASGTVREGQMGGNMLPVHAQIRNPLIIEGTHGDPMIEALTKLGMDEDKAARMVERAYENRGYIGKEVETRARAAGYDGLMQYRDGDLSEVVSYNPNAVKSAIGNQGTYDTSVPDLSKADGGSIGNLSKAAQENLAKLRELRAKIAPVADAWAAKQAEDANKYTRDIQPFKMPINKAAGGKMVKGAAKGFKKLFEDAPAGKIIEAPSLMLPSRLSDMKNTVRAQKGEYGARRVERAADEIPNLERMYQEEALKRVFTGDNARALMTMNPADFEKYSAPLDPRFMSEHSTRFTTSGERLGYPDYMESYLPNVGAFNDVPFLEINKKQQGSTAAPFISGHEGRHRNRVLAGKGETSGLVQLLPRAELREPFPRRSQEDYLDALKKELKLTGNRVKPETYSDNFKQVDIKRPAIELPDIYAKGGIAHMGKGGKLVKKLGRVGSQLFGNADEVAPAIKGGTRKFGSDDGGLNIMKETGGNWLGGRLDKDLALLRRRTPTGKDPVEGIEQLNQSFPDVAQRPEYVNANIGRLQHDVALNKWVDSNLKNYIKKQMGTQDDPVRALAEQGVTHRKGLIEAYPDDAQNSLMEERRLAGMPEEGVAKSPLAKAWERASDEAINPRRAGDIQQAPERLVKMQEAEQAMKDAREALNQRFIEHLEANGFKPNEIDKLSRGMPYNEKAKMVGDEEFQKATVEYQATRLPLVESDAKKNLENPWISKVDPDTSVYNAYTGDLGFDHIMDVLRQDVAAGRIRPEQLNKVSMEQAVRRTHEFDQEMAKRMAETQIKNTAGMPTHKEYPDQGFKWIQLSQPEELPKGWSKEASGAYVGPNGERTIVNPSRQTLEDSLKYEGDTMGHCVGSYCDDVAEGNSKIYSLRDAKGEPHVTIEVGKNGLREQFFKLPQQEKEKINSTYKGWESKLGREPTPEEHDSQLYKIMSEMGYAPTEKITQIKGKGNAKPKEEYLPFVQDFVKSGQWSDIGDFGNAGLIDMKSYDTLSNFLKESGKEYPRYVTKQEFDKLEGIYLNGPETPPAEGMAEGGGAFKKIQFMDKGGVTTSGGDFSAEDVGADSYFSDEFKRRLAGLKEDSKTQMEKEYKQLSRAGGKKDLALRVGAQLAGGLPDILNMGLEGVDYLQSKVPALSRPASVLDVANSKDRVPKFALSSENPWLGSERIMDSLKEAKLLGDNEYPFMELASNFAVPVGAAALIKGGKKTAKGVKAMTSKPQGGLSATAR